jgi:nitroreductase
MDFMDISKMRVTVRQFDKKPVEQEQIEKILEAGRWSPTAVNYQPHTYSGSRYAGKPLQSPGILHLWL